MLPLNYGRDVPLKLIEEMEFHAKRLGVSLDAMERIGQDMALTEKFIVAAEVGRGQEFARAVEFNEPAPASLDLAEHNESLGLAA